MSEGEVPDIFWDGILPFSQLLFGQPEQERIVLGDNGDATFLAINPVQYMIGLFNPADRNYDNFRGDIKPLEPVYIEGDYIEGSLWENSQDISLLSSLR